MTDNLYSATTMSPKLLYSNTLGTSSADLCAPAASHAQIIRRVIVCNITGTAATVTFTCTASGGSAKTVISAFTVPPNATYEITELAGLALGPGDKLSGLAGTASAINCVISGTDHT